MTIFTKLLRLAGWLVFNVLLLILLLALGEGLASLALFIQEVAQTPPLAERRHTQYDELLGWVNSPNIYIEDMYGPGVYLRTNSQGFRNNQDFEASPPEGKLRLICSGDSFTFGYGVDNDHTWCQLLSLKDPRLETVNMGQGGYGIDQAYLWYQRDAAPLQHQIHLFAFITTDFKRMERAEFNGYGKPLLQVQNDALVVTNVPVPRRFFFVPWLTQQHDAIEELKTVQLFSQLFSSEAPGEPAPQASSSPETTAARILDELVRLNKAKNSMLVLIYLPGQNFSGQDLNHWRQAVKTISEQRGILFLDLVDEFKDLSEAELKSLFIQKGELDYQGAAGHYTVQGNQAVADLLYEKLLALPDLASLLANR